MIAILVLAIGFLLILILRKFSFEIAFISNILATAFIIYSFYPQITIEHYWLNEIKLSFLIDKTNSILAFLVALISTIIILYSYGYMKEEKNKPRFYSLMCLFSSSMIGIIFSNNFLTLILFWEIVGLTSYFLIGFWYEKKIVSYAARKALTTIIFGDILMFAGILIFLTNFNTLEFSLNTITNKEILKISIILILIGLFSKSAQFPLHIWLADAMEGPTPVSALLHSATMVKAGIFVMMKILPLIEAVYLTNFLIVIGLITATIGALLAISEYDTKRVLAFSTINQLGIMTFCLGLNSIELMLIYSTTQTFSKSFLFMYSGLISKHERDLRRLSINPKSFVFFLGLIGVLATAGFPFIGDFFGKDSILEFLISKNNYLAIFTIILFFLTGLYIGRWLFIQSNNYKKFETVIENYKSMKIATFSLIPLLLLQFFILNFFGFEIKINLFTTIISAIISVSSLVLSTKLINYNFPDFLKNRFYIDYAYEKLSSFLLFKVLQIFNYLDKKIDRAIDYNHNIFSFLSKISSKIQSGIINDYILAFAIGVLILIFLIEFLI